MRNAICGVIPWWISWILIFVFGVTVFVTHLLLWIDAMDRWQGGHDLRVLDKIVLATNPFSIAIFIVRLLNGDL